MVLSIKLDQILFAQNTSHLNAASGKSSRWPGPTRLKRALTVTLYWNLWLMASLLWFQFLYCSKFRGGYMVPKVGRPRFWRCGIVVDWYLLQIQFQLTIMCAYVVYLFTCLLNFLVYYLVISRNVWSWIIYECMFRYGKPHHQWQMCRVICRTWSAVLSCMAGQSTRLNDPVQRNSWNTVHFVCLVGVLCYYRSLYWLRNVVCIFQIIPNQGGSQERISLMTVMFFNEFVFTIQVKQK